MYRLNVWQQAVNPWLPPGACAACLDTFTLDDLKGEPCVVRFDKSRSCDFSAFVALSQKFFEARGMKPIVAIANSEAYSAGY